MRRITRSRAICSVVALGLFCWNFPAFAQEGSSIGYPSVAAALEALRSDPTATESTDRGWILFQRGRLEFWSFTPEGHPAHPSAAKRTGYQAGGGWHVVTKLLCQSTKASCDALREEYRQLDERMKKDIQRRHGGTGS